MARSRSQRSFTLWRTFSSLGNLGWNWLSSKRYPSFLTFIVVAVLISRVLVGIVRGCVGWPIVSLFTLITLLNWLKNHLLVLIDWLIEKLSLSFYRIVTEMLDCWNGMIFFSNFSYYNLRLLIIVLKSCLILQIIFLGMGIQRKTAEEMITDLPNTDVEERRAFYKQAIRACIMVGIMIIINCNYA